jgi:hypothetical protein
MLKFDGINFSGTVPRHVCEKCARQYWMEHKDRPKEFLEAVRSLIALHNKGTISEEVYKDLLRLAISLYIQGQVESSVTHTLDKALCEKLSPKNLLGALV